MVEVSLSKMRSRVVRDLICYLVWRRKGKVEGIHPDFGKLSYVKSKKLSSNYHINDDERVEILLDLSEKLNNL